MAKVRYPLSHPRKSKKVLMKKLHARKKELAEQRKSNKITESPGYSLTTDHKYAIANEQVELDSGNTKAELPEYCFTTDDFDVMNQSSTIKSEPDDIKFEEYVIEARKVSVPTTKAEIDDDDMGVQEMNTLKLNADFESLTNSNPTYDVNTSPALVKQAIQKNWKKIVKKTLKPRIVREWVIPPLPKPIEKENRKRKEIKNPIELCVLCGKNLSKPYQKKSVTKFLDLILLVTDVDVTQYSTSPIACGVCYKFLIAITKFQEQVKEAKILILIKQTNVTETVPLQEIEFLDTNNLNILSVSEISAEVNLRNQLPRLKHPQNTSELPHVCNTESVLNTVSIKNKQISKFKTELSHEIEDIEEIQNEDIELQNFSGGVETIKSNIDTVINHSSCENIAIDNNSEKGLLTQISEVNSIKTKLPNEELNKTENTALLNLSQGTSTSKNISSTENNTEFAINEVQIVESNINTAVMKSQTGLNSTLGKHRCYKKYRVLNKPIKKVPSTAWLETAGYVCGKVYARPVCTKPMPKPKKSPLVTCEKCKKVLRAKSMAYHKQTHKKQEENIQDDKYICSVCGKIYTRLSGLQQHEVTHGEKQHICRICKQSFHYLKYLTRHMRSHSGEKPYACSECGKTFSILWNFQQHRRLHTNSKPYKCRLCSAAFSYNVSLKRHIVKTHAANAISMSGTANDVPSNSQITE